MSNVHLPQEFDDNESLTVRFTVRLPEDLLSWVRQQGGSSYVRELLAQHRAAGVGPAGIGGASVERSLRPASSLRDQWEQLAYEQESLVDERASLLRDEERLLDRQRRQLDHERTLLEERREQLEDEWNELELARDETRIGSRFSPACSGRRSSPWTC